MELSTFTKLRFWLIQKLAGRNVVILNACITLVPVSEPFKLRIKGVKGGLFLNSDFPTYKGRMLQIEQMARGV